MFKTIYYSLITSSLFLCASHAAIIVTGDGLTTDNKVEIDTYLRKYTSVKADTSSWTTEEKNRLLENPKDFSDVIFMKDLLQEKFPDRNIRVAYVPDTVWNLSAIYSAYVGQLGDLISKYPPIGKTAGITKEGDLQSSYFLLSDILFADIKKDGIQSVYFYQDRAQQYMDKLSQLPNNDGLLTFNEQDTRLLMASIAEEVKASKNNQFLFFRGTSGYEYKSYLKTPEQYKQDEEWMCYSSEELASSLNRYTTCYNNPLFFHTKEKSPYMLDYPGHGFGRSALERIASLSQFMLKDTIDFISMTSTKQLSYGDSLLSGFLYDKTACPYFYYKNNQVKYTYAVPIDKKSFYNAEEFYAKNKSLVTDGIFSGQEFFHPRLKQIEMSDCKSPLASFSIACGALLPYNFTNILDLEYTNQMKIYNVVMAKYTLQHLELLDKALVFIIDGVFQDPNNPSSEGIALMERQNDLTKGMKEFFKKFEPILQRA